MPIPHALDVALHHPPGLEPSASVFSLRLYCLSDHGCPGAEKCCQDGKVWTCLLPTTGESWAVGPGWLHAKPCAFPPAKPGFCPWKRAQRRAAACPNRCTDDRDCPGEHKCCFSGCGLACTPPDTGTAPPALSDPHIQPTTALVLAQLPPGRAQCVPGPTAGQAAAAVPGQVCSWWHQPGPREWSHHAAVKPGVCPTVLRGSLGPCLEQCDTDSDCTGDNKCCTTGCGHICKPPTKGTA
ncbi:hypothetical protein RLOC_00013557 [Lonchura striata]|uniref:WAP domain-containing protein n=1 Tax=Lonchura striata TaxID=40157 RepID=A0A218UA85_9PASE|nr:hypothetical protein RLOC_00013557 [Lonchura striata domestica]